MRRIHKSDIPKIGKPNPEVVAKLREVGASIRKPVRAFKAAAAALPKVASRLAGKAPAQVDSAPVWDVDWAARIEAARSSSQRAEIYEECERTLLKVIRESDDTAVYTRAHKLLRAMQVAYRDA